MAKLIRKQLKDDDPVLQRTFIGGGGYSLERLRAIKGLQEAKAKAAEAAGESESDDDGNDEEEGS